MDRIHEEKFDVEDRLQKVREELEDIKRQNEEYQRNISLMAKVWTKDQTLQDWVFKKTHYLYAGKDSGVD